MERVTENPGTLQEEPQEAPSYLPRGPGQRGHH
jgi:hypothetical protein